MKITECDVCFSEAVRETAIGSISVKKKGKNFHELVDDEYGHGIIVHPAISPMDVRNDEELRQKLVDEFKEPFVTVRGYGWPHEKKFVWTGTTAEFLETWIGD